MKKKLITGCFILSVSVMAFAPLLIHNNSSAIHPISSLNELTLEKVSSVRQFPISTDDTATYPQNGENSSLLGIKKQELPSRGGTIVKKTAAAKPAVSIATKKPAVAKPTAVKKTTTSSSTSKSTTISSAIKTTTASSTARAKTSVSRGTASYSNPKAIAVIGTAKSLIGVPYLWGGVTPSGFDCSGFSQYVLAKNGISVPRTAAEQYNSGISVSKSDLRVGDLVFFTTYKPGPSHLGFYIGDGNFIHASSSKGVTISSLSSSYYAGRYIGARRVIF